MLGAILHTVLVNLPSCINRIGKNHQQDYVLVRSVSHCGTLQNEVAFGIEGLEILARRKG